VDELLAVLPPLLRRPLSAVGWLQDLAALIASNASITHAWAWLTRVDELLERESLTDDRVSQESDAVLALYIAAT
jgi:hypothetical protein